MSLTSYRAAPPRATCVSRSLHSGPFCKYKEPHRAGSAWRPRTASRAGNRDEKMKCAFYRPGSDLLSRVLRRSTIGAGAFHGRVRNGIGCSRSAITTRSTKRTLFREAGMLAHPCDGHWQMRMIKPIELLVPVSFMRCRTSTPGLSTWSSSTALREHSFPGGFPA